MRKTLAQNSQKTRRGRGKGKPFVAGGDERINAGGRPKLPEEVRAELEVMRGPLTLKAIRTLERNMDSADGMVSNVAAREWLKKTLPDGAVAMKLEITGADGGPIQTKVVELDDSPGSVARVIDIMRSAGLLTGAAEGDSPEADAVHSPKPD